MKKIIYMAVAAIAVLSSCSSDIESISNDTTGKEVLKFTAKMEGSATRATLLNPNSDHPTPAWEVGDVISIDGHAYTATTAGTASDFTGTGATEATHHAYFPASLYNGGTPSLPATVSETWTADKFDMPMYAESTEATLEFKNLCGVLEITVTNEQIGAVKAIKVSSANKAISGAFTVEADAAVLTDANNIANTLTITYTDAVTTTAEGKVFYVPVPAQTYQELKIELDADGNGFTKSMTTKAATDITVKRRNIYSITFADNAGPATTGTAKRTGGIDVNWVQLWAGGPKFAEYNVGAEKAEDYGGYYTWGGSENWSNTDFYDGAENLTGDNDTATKLWGSAWRMPTQTELQALLTNCNVVVRPVNGVAGFKFSGKGDYASNSVFLPAAGYSRYDNHVSGKGLVGNYWSSSYSSMPLSAYYLSVNSGNANVSQEMRPTGNSVRAVLAE